MSLSRRQFLGGSLAATTSAMAPIRAIGAAAPMRLAVERRVIEVNRQPASVYGIVGSDGRHGLALDPGERFRVTLENRAGLPTLIHWHGREAAIGAGWRARLSQIPAAARPRLRIRLCAAGTHRMHARGAARTALIRPADRARRPRLMREVVVMLYDSRSPTRWPRAARQRPGGTRRTPARRWTIPRMPATAPPCPRTCMMSNTTFLANDRTDDPR
jgi:FtsP/CotA-like multicopper oxidase with cupredoxin domain